MSIGKQIKIAVAERSMGNTDEALAAISIAIDATATKEYGKRHSYKRFVDDNFPLISFIGFGGLAFRSLGLPLQHSSLKKFKCVTHTFPEILYHVVRCSLIHEAVLDPCVSFVGPVDRKTKRSFAMSPNAIELPVEMIDGLILAVVVAPVNSGEGIVLNTALTSRGVRHPVRFVSGKRTEALTFLHLVDKERAE